VKVYSIEDGIKSTRFPDFVNPYHFQARGYNDENYNQIFMTFRFVWIFPLTSSMLFSILAVHCVYPTLYSYLKTVRKGKMKVLNLTDLEVKSEQFRSVHSASLIGTNAAVTIVIITFQVISLMRSVEYGNKVLYYSEKDDEGNRLRDDRSVLVGCLALNISWFASFFGTPLILLNCYHRNTINKLHKFAAQLTTVNVIFLASYFSLYMLLAFVHNPFQASLTYLFITVCTFCLFFAFFGLFGCCYSFVYTCSVDDDQGDPIVSFGLMSCVASTTTAASVIFMAIACICIFTLGSFNNLLALQNLVFPGSIALLSFVFLKPALKYLRSIHDEDDEDADNKHDHNNTIQDSDLEKGNFSRCHHCEITEQQSNDTNSVSND